MGESKRRREKNSNYGEQTEKNRVLNFWENDRKYLTQKFKQGKVTTRFFLYKGVVLTNRGDFSGLICRATESDRYERYKHIIDAAIHDLANKQDGVWYFNAADKWYRQPLPDGFLDVLRVSLSDEILKAIEIKETKINSSTLQSIIIEFMEQSRDALLDSGEIYCEMVERGYLSPCPTSITSSTIGAIFNALIGEIETANSCYAFASNFVGSGNAVARAEWLKFEILRLTNIELPLILTKV